MVGSCFSVKAVCSFFSPQEGRNAAGLSSPRPQSSKMNLERGDSGRTQSTFHSGGGGGGGLSVLRSLTSLEQCWGKHQAPHSLPMLTQRA